MSFRSILKSRYQVVAEPETYWTCFAYDDFTPDELHCTHKYLGELDSAAVEQIVNTLDSYFASSPFEPFTIPFTKEAFFGEGKDVRVLTPDWKKESKEAFLLDLKKQLDGFVEDTFPSYKPHVTTDMQTVNAPFGRYLLLRDNRIMREYK